MPRLPFLVAAPLRLAALLVAVLVLPLLALAQLPTLWRARRRLRTYGPPALLATLDPHLRRPL